MDAIAQQIQLRIADYSDDKTARGYWVRDILLQALRWADTCRNAQEFELFAYSAMTAAAAQEKRSSTPYNSFKAEAWHSAWCAARRAQGKGL